MVPEAEPPLEGIYDMLGSVSSCHVQTITLDLNLKDAKDALGKEYLQCFRRLDIDLHRIASVYRGVGRTVVKLSAVNPFVLGLYLRRFRRRGELILGTRIGGPSGFGDLQWFGV